MYGEVEHRLFKGLGIPVGTADVIAFEPDDVATLVAVVFLTTVFARLVQHDIYIIPDTARNLLYVSHHEFIRVDFRNSGDVDGWVKRMEERGFPLPRAVPDATFEKPHWTRGDC